MLETIGYTWADFLGCGIILAGFLIGLRQGLSGQATTVLIGLGIWVCLSRWPLPMQSWVETHTALSSGSALLVARLVLIALPLCAGLMIHALLRKLLQIAGMAWLDHLGGGMVGALAAFLLVVAIFALVNHLPPASRPEGMGTRSWMSRTVINGETQLVESLMHRVTNAAFPPRAVLPDAGTRPATGTP